jgi:hypothetical protein
MRSDGFEVRTRRDWFDLEYAFRVRVARRLRKAVERERSRGAAFRWRLRDLDLFFISLPM